MKTMSRLPARGRSSIRGLTLIEVLIGVAISAVIIIALLTVYMAGQKYFFNQSAKADAIEEIRAPLARIARDLREAAQVSQATVTAGGNDYATAADCLVLDVPSHDISGIIIPGLEDSIIYAVDAGRLHRLVVANGPGRTSGDDLLAEGVNVFSLAFFKEDGITPVAGAAYAEAFVVNVTLTASRPAVQRQGQPYVETLHTRVKLRNKTLPLPET